MFAHNWVLGLVYSLTSVTFLGLTACSGASHKDTEEALDAGHESTGGSSAREASSGGGASRSASSGGGASRSASSGGGASRSASSGGDASRSASSGGARATGGNAGTGGVGGANGPSSTVACTPSTGVDVPDNSGTDSNCDGVDGNAATSLFVSPQGLDSDGGTMAAPFRTIGHAISVALSSKSPLDVLVCEGNYAENLKIASSVGLHGGYDCKTWARTGGRSVVAPTSGVALRIEGVTSPMKLSKLTLQSADAAVAGESSQAVQIVDSNGVEIEHSAIVAGNGARGASGATPANTWAGAAPAGLDGSPLQFDTADMSIACHDTSYFGDSDFDGYTDVNNDQSQARCIVGRSGAGSVSNTCATPTQLSMTTYGGKGGYGGIKANGDSPSAPGLGTAGTPTSTPTAGNPGASGKGFGRVAALGYVANNDGGDGAVGQPGVAGKGGDGGSSCLLRVGNMNPTDPLSAYMSMYKRDFSVNITCAAGAAWGGASTNEWASYVYGQAVQIRSVTMFPGSGGGGGGAPGCGGAGGMGGKGGGASIALFVSNSDVSITWSDIAAGNGGAGGDPSDGAAGQLGGNGGQAGAVRVNSSVKLPTLADGTAVVSESNIKGKDGSKGGQGQKGTAGGPGGGGPSVAILWDGTKKPVYDATVTLKMAAGGLPGKLLEGATPALAGISADCISVSAASGK